MLNPLFYGKEGSIECRPYHKEKKDFVGSENTFYNN